MPLLSYVLAALRQGLPGPAVRQGTVGFRRFFLPWVLSGGGKRRIERGNVQVGRELGKILLLRRTP